MQNFRFLRGWVLFLVPFLSIFCLFVPKSLNQLSKRSAAKSKRVSWFISFHFIIIHNLRYRSRASRALHRYGSRASALSIWWLLPQFLKNLKKLSFFYSKRASSPAKTEVLHEKLKIVLPMGILKKKISTPNFTKFLNP